MTEINLVGERYLFILRYIENFALHHDVSGSQRPCVCVAEV